jgi:hypothetical protein
MAKTKELFLVVVRLAEAAPRLAFPVAVAPIAPDPLLPDVSTPMKLTTVIYASLLPDKVGVTVTLLNGNGENALQISALPD